MVSPLMWLAYMRCYSGSVDVSTEVRGQALCVGVVQKVPRGKYHDLYCQSSEISSKQVRWQLLAHPNVNDRYVVRK